MKLIAVNTAPAAGRAGRPTFAPLLAAALLAAAASPAAAEDAGPGKVAPVTELAGSIESSLAASAGAGGAAAFSYDFEEYANLRLKASVGERGTAYAAVNLIAASGDTTEAAESLEALSAHALPATSFVAGANYAAALELERLYFKIDGGLFAAEAGLMRLAFGFGQAWSPSDFLCSPNPLLPDARPRGALAVAATAYPADTARLKLFAAAGGEPLAADAEGAIVGAAADFHGEAASAEVLYAFEAPSGAASWGLHRVGLSAKAEAEAAFVLDALYTSEGQSWAGLSGLEASAGVDYSFLGGDLYVLCQYLYNGPGSLDPGEELGALYADADWSETAPAERLPADPEAFRVLNRRNYLYAALAYSFDDYTRVNLACVACLDDLSFSPALTIEREPFQGLSLSLTCRTYVDARTFSAGGAYGEMGAANAGCYGSVTAKAKLRF